ncbi:alpha/beta hydrolase [Shinella daejeonensis]|uniref:alpha/beta fold hydrolase n=1 Tax=Shinella daejeonensis TaxID=659017 RepID=UPI0020C7B323|nr:alpha/beta hydrolase [Shinella daejeonensis]
MFSAWQPLESPSGATLALRHAPAGAAERSVLLVSHGLAEHGGRYAAFAARMAAEGLHVYVHDHRGHGHTAAADAPVGRFARRDGASRVLTDMHAVRDYAAARHPGLPVLLFGHSMGGLLALAYAGHHPAALDGLAVWNASFEPGLAGRAALAILAIERMLKGSDVPSAWLARLTFEAWGNAVPGHRTLCDWLSHDPAEVDAYIADPLCGFDPSVSLWRDILRLAYSAAAPAALARLPKRLPIHIAGGDEDPATDYGRAITALARRLKKSRLEDVTTVVYRGCRHETLKEIRSLRDPAVDALAGWCRRVTLAGRRYPENA